MDDTLIYYGGSVKALGGGKVGGYLVLFSGAADPDLSGEYFTKSTDFFLDADQPRAVILYDHGLDPTLKARKLGRGDLKVDDVGVWLEAQLTLRDDYEKAIYAMAEAGKLGWSSGSAPHLVEREKIKKSVEIKSWPIVEASLTPQPVEPRTAAITLKSYREAKASDLFTSLIEGDAPAALPFVDHSEAVLAAVADVCNRAKSIQELRVKAGRVLNAANRQRLSALRSQLNDLSTEIQSLLDETEAKVAAETEEKSASPEMLYSLLAQFEQHKHARRRAV